MTARVVGLALAALVLVGVGAAPGLAGAAPVSTPAHLTAAAPWTWTDRGPSLGAQTIADGQGAGVSCSTVNHCVTVGDEGLVMYTIDGGTTLHWSSVPWTDTLTQQGYRLGAVTCTLASCLAISTSAVDDAQSSVFRSTDGGVTWTDVGPLPKAGITQWATAVACDRTVHCVIVGPGGGIWRSTDDGSTWTPIVPGGTPLAYSTVTCPRVDSCVAGSATETSTIVGGVVTNTPLGATGNLTALSCGATDSCVATTSQHDVLQSTDVGAHWSNLGSTLPTAVTVRTLSCTTGRACVGLASAGKRVVRTLDGGETWTRFNIPAPGPAGPTDLTCNTLRCVAVGAAALYMNSVDGGSNWVTVNAVPGMAALECQPPSLLGSPCLSGGMSDIGKTTTSGQFWRAPIEGVMGLNIFSVSCFALTGCVAIGQTNLFRSLDNGDRWTTSPAPWSVTNAPKAGTCVGPTFCVAVGSGSMFTSLTGSLTWNLSSVPGGPALTAVSCPTTTQCFALDGADGVVYRGARTVGLRGPLTPEWTWRPSDLNVISPVSGLTCPTASVCEVVGTAGVTLRTTDGGDTWSQVVTDTNDGWGTVTCPSTTLCVAGGAVSAGPDTGHVLMGVSDDGGATWTRQILAVGTPIAAIDCPSTTLCVAGGTTVYTGHP